MRLIIRGIPENPLSLMRRAGYAFQREENGEMSFVRVLASAGYPRFHCYTKLEGLNLKLSLHLDQKKHTHGEGTRHHGEYENEGPVQDEAKHFQTLFGEKVSIIA